MDADSELLRRFVETKSQADFAELVRRNVDLVFCAALRRLRNSHQAEEVAQTVFIDLARKANQLYQHPALVSWLFTSTRFAAAKLIRFNLRQQARDYEALMMRDNQAGETNVDWTRLGPILDDAIQKLNQGDQQAVLLRFYKNHSFSSIARDLGLSEESARQRTGRALGKIQDLLRKQGVTSTTAALTLALENQLASAAPVGLAASVTSSTLASFSTLAVKTGALAGLVKSFGAANVAFAIGGTLAAIAIGIGLNETQRSHTRRADLNHPMVSASQPDDPVSHLIPTENALLPEPSANASPRVLTAEQVTRRNARQEARRDAKNRTLATQRLAPLFNQLSLTAEQKEKLIQLVLDDHQAGVDFAAANAREGINISIDPDSYWESSVQSHREFLAEVESLLGPDGYAAFRANDLAVRQSLVLEHLQKKLTPENAPLNPESSNQLLGVLQDLHTFAVDDRVISRAKSFLTPSQVDALVAEQARQQMGPQKPALQRVIGENLSNTH